MLWDGYFSFSAYCLITSISQGVLIYSLFCLSIMVQLDVKEKELKKKLDFDEERKDRSPEERIQEANEYRSLFL